MTFADYMLRGNGLSKSTNPQYRIFQGLDMLRKIIYESK